LQPFPHLSLTTSDLPFPSVRHSLWHISAKNYNETTIKTAYHFPDCVCISINNRVNHQKLLIMLFGYLILAGIAGFALFFKVINWFGKI